MDRRTTLATMLGKRKNNREPNKLTSFIPASSGLDPYTGSWGFEQAAHLLRRASFAPSYQMIKEVLAMGMDDAVAVLLADQPMPDPPLNYGFPNDPYVPVGETWIDAPYDPDINLIPYRRNSLLSWNFDQMRTEGISAREKMTLFWHNHYATEMNVVNDPKFIYRYYTLLRENALGNFRELTKKITIDPTMLRYLNGNQNTVGSPNENYARELLELFTVGKGDLIGPGDYSNYTEEDIAAIARVLTGWRVSGYRAFNPNVPLQSFFNPNLHDTGTKQLSYHFNNAVISNAGEDEYKVLIDIIFQQDAAARYIARKLYRWFIYYVIDETVETNVIEPLAQLIVANDYEMKPALEALFKSQHFYDMYYIGPMIKNPVDFTLSLFKPFEVQIPNVLQAHYASLLPAVSFLELQQMSMFNPPSVAGWPAYYQEPSFYRIWTNSVTLPLRREATDIMTTTGYGGDNTTIRIDVLAFVATLDNAIYPGPMIEEMVSILFPQPLTPSQIDYLKGVLLPGLPDYEWTDEYGAYLANPANEDLANSVENKLRNLLAAMLAMPEFYLS